VPGANKVACARCGIPGLSLDMDWQHDDSPGYPRVRALVHPECKDMPHPSARAKPTRPVLPPYTTQVATATLESPTDAITVTSATFFTTGTATATLAQVTADPTVVVNGTGFTSGTTFGRVHEGSSLPLRRVTTFVGATQITFELEAQDLVDGYLYVGAVKLLRGTHATDDPQRLTVT
jgi:hypothetical protein